MFKYFLAVVLLWGHAVQAQGCAPDDLCAVPLGEYRYEAPRNAGAAPPVIVHFHGAGNSSAAVMRTRSIVDAALARGYVFIALEGRPRPGRDANNWAVRDGRAAQRDEAAFALQAVADLNSRFPLNLDRVYLTGFSRGASAIWDIACHMPEGFAGFAPASGAFWEPLPMGCAAPVRLSHYHGWTDGTVPLEGRRFSANSAVAQGDVYAGLRILRETHGVISHVAQGHSISGEMMCKSWAGGDLQFCLHPRGHLPPDGWIDHAIDFFEAGVMAQ